MVPVWLSISVLFFVCLAKSSKYNNYTICHNCHICFWCSTAIRCYLFEIFVAIKTGVIVLINYSVFHDFLSDLDFKLTDVILKTCWPFAN